MYYNFTIKEILRTHIEMMKIDLCEDLLYQKVTILFDIWVKQKELRYLFDLYNTIEKDTVLTMDENITRKLEENSTYKEQYVSFLMDHNLIFLMEVSDKIMLCNLLYYWLLSEIKVDKEILENI